MILGSTTSCLKHSLIPQLNIISLALFPALIAHSWSVCYLFVSLSVSPAVFASSLSNASFGSPCVSYSPKAVLGFQDIVSNY